MPQTIEIKIPDIGDFKEVAVIEVLVKPGDVIRLKIRWSRLNPTRPAWMCPRHPPAP